MARIKFLSEYYGFKSLHDLRINRPAAKSMNKPKTNRTTDGLMRRAHLLPIQAPNTNVNARMPAYSN